MNIAQQLQAEELRHAADRYNMSVKSSSIRTGNLLQQRKGSAMFLELLEKHLYVYLFKQILRKFIYFSNHRWDIFSVVDQFSFYRCHTSLIIFSFKVIGSIHKNYKDSYLVGVYGISTIVLILQPNPVYWYITKYTWFVNSFGWYIFKRAYAHSFCDTV